MYPLPGQRLRGYLYRMSPRHLLLRVRQTTRRARRFVARQILHADDPPHKLALGVAIGIWVTFTPTIGIQMLLVVFLAWLFRANKVVGVPLVWLSNPATFVPIFYPCYRIGRALLGSPDIGWSWWKELAEPPPGWWEGVHFYIQKSAHVFQPLWLGCLLVATAAALLTYAGVYAGLRVYREKVALGCRRESSIPGAS